MLLLKVLYLTYRLWLGEIKLEFNEKLQQLRKQKNLTQEALAQRIFVSRAVVSKWESGRGYPSIDSLKGISKAFNVSIDDLLSGEELITIAEADEKEKVIGLRCILYGLLDIMSFIFFFIPLFGQKNGDVIQSVSMLKLELQESYVWVVYAAIISINIIFGLVEILLQNFQNRIWKKFSPIISLVITIIATVIFIISQQPYIAFFMLWLLILKGFIYLKQH